MPDTIESRITAQKAVVDGLITAANNKTGVSFDKLPEAVNELIDGYHSGEQVYETSRGVLYTKNTVINSTNLLFSTNQFYEATDMETFSLPNYNGDFKWGSAFYNCKKLTSISMLKITKYSAYLSLNGCSILSSITLGSIGYPLSEGISVSMGSYTTGQQATNPILTVYVADDTVLPLSGQPWGLSKFSVIYRSATTGEVIPVA